MEHAIETRGLRKVYGGLEALKGLDLQVPTGCCYGLLGPNGAGKSTLVKTLLSIVRPTAGSATLLGLDFRSRESRRAVGYLPEGHRFPRYLTGRGVCQYFGHLAGHGGAELAADIEDKLGLVGMSEWADTRIAKYSKGMNQRVGLAQALIGKPKLVFLDEPTDGVDPKGRHELRQVIKEVAAGGATIFLNSHLLQEVEITCDRIAILDKGTLLMQGTPEEIKRTVAGSGKQTTAIEVTFRTSALAPELWARLGSRGATSSGAEAFAMTLASEDEITGVIDELRAADTKIYAVRPHESNLEDAFIKLVTEVEVEA